MRFILTRPYTSNDLRYVTENGNVVFGKFVYELVNEFFISGNGMRGNHYHILRGHVIIFNAAGFDDHQALLPVNTGNIAPGKGDKAVLGKQQISPEHLFFQFFQHFVTSCSDRQWQLSAF